MRGAVSGGTMHHSPVPSGAALALRLCVPTVLLMFTALQAADIPIPQGGKIILTNSYTGVFRSGKTGKMKITNSGHVQFPKAIRIAVAEKETKSWDTQYSELTFEPVSAGDVLLIAIYLRCGRVIDANASALAQVNFQTFGMDKQYKQLRAGLEVPPVWTRILLPVQAPVDIPAGKAGLCIMLGFKPQFADIGAIEVYNYGKSVDIASLPDSRTSYIGNEEDAAWRKEARARIDKIRKAELQVVAVDSSGKPVKNAQVSIRLLRHSFPFGTEVPHWMVPGSALPPHVSPAERERFKEILLKYYNTTVFGSLIRWSSWDDLKRQELAKIQYAWLNERFPYHFSTPLFWPYPKRVPDAVKALCAEKKTGEIEDHLYRWIRELVAFYGDKCQWYEVLNEQYTPDHRFILNAYSSSEAETISRWMKVMRTIIPAAGRTIINENTMLTGGGSDFERHAWYEKLLTELNRLGTPVDGMGFQGHFASIVTPPARILDILDRFGKLVEDLHITEFDVPGDNQALQEKYLRDFYLACFSHPSVKSIIMWGFWKKSHWRPECALWDDDFSLSGGGKAYVHLMDEEWNTRADGMTDSKGTFSVRSFLGEYEIAITAGDLSKKGKTTLSAKGARVTVNLK